MSGEGKEGFATFLEELQKLEKVLGGQPLKWKDRHPSLTMHVKEVVTSPARKKFSWLENHKYVVLTDWNGHCFEGVIHNNLAGLLQHGRKYMIWYAHTDRLHDRFIEIICVNFVED